MIGTKYVLQEKSLIDLLTKNNFTIICEKFDQIQGNINGLNMTIRAKKINSCNIYQAL